MSQVSDLSWLAGAVKVPFLLVPKTTKGKFHMAPPSSIDLIGSYPLGTCTKPHVTVDLAVTIPNVSTITHSLSLEVNMQCVGSLQSAHLSVIRLSSIQKMS